MSDTNRRTPNTGGRTATAAMGAVLQPMDQKFLMDAAMGNNAEIQMGQMALQKATSPQVKNFAQMMIDHHTAANAELAKVAQQMGTTLPTGVPPNERATMEGMQDLSGTEFDMAYIKHQMASHAMSVDMYKENEDDGNNKELKGYAEKSLPTIEKHYSMTKTLDRQMTPAPAATAVPKSP